MDRQWTPGGSYGVDREPSGKRVDGGSIGVDAAAEGQDDAVDHAQDMIVVVERDRAFRQLLPPFFR